MVSDIMYVLILSLSSTMLPVASSRASVLNQISLIDSGRYIIVMRKVVWVE